MRILMVVLALLCAGCVSPTAPPEGAVLVSADHPELARLWRETEECSQLRRRPHEVPFYVMPDVQTVTYPRDGRAVAGYWRRDNSGAERIVIAGAYWAPRPIWEELVRHEVLHALLRQGDHPTRFFRELCGKVVVQPSFERHS
jgi:hypothetical protein